jgi:hypothetical protein
MLAVERMTEERTVRMYLFQKEKGVFESLEKTAE